MATQATFLEEIEDFLLNLRDSYGFVLPVDRLQACLVCARDIEDVEEVLYRLQSLTCSSQEQTEAFRSLFAQRFLKQVPQSGGKKKKGSGKDSRKEDARKLQQLTSAAESARRWEEKKNEEAAESLREAEKLRERLQKAREEYEQAAAMAPSVEEAAGRALPDRSREKVAEGEKAVRDCFDGIDAAGGRSGRFRTALQDALNSADWSKKLDGLADSLMASAREARGSRNTPLFSAMLKAVQAVKSLKPAVSRSIGSAEKKDYTTAVRARKTLEDVQAGSLRELERRSAEADRERDSAVSRQNAARRSTQEAERNLKNWQDDQARRKSLEEGKTVVKASAAVHRDLFLGGVNAVQTTSEQAELMKRSLQSMSTEQREQVLTFLRTNARVFRQTLRRRQITPRHRQVDVRATVRAAGRTGGEPVVIRYKEPKKSHARVVMLTDISGSCRNASTLALYFMALMDEVFPGGCRKFAFVNTLVPADRFFRDRSADEGVQAVLKSVPSRGVYSDYGVPIHTLREDYGGTFHRDTTVIILGDARNNRRDTAAGDLKYIADRCSRVYWLNTDDPRKWNQGDSIIGVYEGCGAEVHHVATVGDLITFLMEAGRNG